jgi:hypothetical protein
VLAGTVPATDAGTGDAAAPDGDSASLDADASWLDADADAAAAAEAGGEAGTPGVLAFGGMTADVQLPTSGTFDIALVAPGQSSCHQAQTVGQVTIDAGKRATAVLMGIASEKTGSRALSVVGFTDAPVDPQSARVRFIHAALGTRTTLGPPALSVRAGQTLLAPEIDPGKAAASSTAPDVDPLGYATLQGLPPTTALQIATVGDAAPVVQWATQPSDLGVSVGSVHTAILASLEQGAVAVIWCGDAIVAGGPVACVVMPALH